MKKMISWLLAIVMVFSVIPLAAFADTAPVISFTTTFTENLTIGDTFTVTANFDTNPGINSIGLPLKWNENVVSFTGFTMDDGYLDSNVFQRWTPTVNNTIGIVTAANATNITKAGKLFTANFTIVGSGKPEIGFVMSNPTDTSKQFQMGNEAGDLTETAANNIDYSAIANLSVAAPEPEGPAIPDGAPFTAVTTDKGNAIAIEKWADLSFDPYGMGGSEVTASHYHITIPADATEAYVKFNMPVDGFMSQNYMIGEREIGSNYSSVNHDDLEESAEGGMAALQYTEDSGTAYTNIIIPLEFAAGDFSGSVFELSALKTDDDLYYAVGPQDNNSNIIALFSLGYAEEKPTTYKINIDENITGGTVSAANEAGETITEAAAGDIVYLNLQPNDGYKLQTFAVTDAKGPLGTDNGFFQMPVGDVTITATFASTASTHTCSYDKKTVDAKYLKSEATCTSGAVYYKSCECGLFDNSENAATFVSGEPVGCVYENGVCKWCGATEPILSFTASGQTLEAVTAEGYCSDYDMTAQKLTVTVPAGVNTVTINCAASMCAYIDHGFTDLAPTGKSAEIDLNQDLTFVCVYVTLDDGNDACYHVYFEQEAGDVDPEPEVPAATGITLSNSALVENAAGSATNYTLNMAKGSSQTLTVTLEPAGAQDTVNWASSDESVATVENGVITAQGKGTATIIAYIGELASTAADEGSIIASINVTVGEGYTVTLPEDKTLNVGETVSIPVIVGHSDSTVTIFNSFDMTFTYDDTLLDLTSTEIEGMTVTAANGTVQVQRYGKDMTVGSTAFTLTFEAIGNGTANVVAVDGKILVGESEEALKSDAAKATVLDTTTEIVIGGYTVALPDDFTGDSAVEPGEDYTFEAKDKNYDYEVKATIDGTEVPVEETSDGSFKIAADDITGNIVITSTKTGKLFDVTMGEDMTGENTAQYMTEYTATLNKADGYNYQIEVTIGGTPYTRFNYDPATGKVTIPGADITGAIVFDSNKTAKTADKHSVEIGGNASGDVTAEQEATDGQDYTFTVNKLVGYSYIVTATMNGVEVEVIDNGDGTYTIENVTGELVITVNKTYDMEVEVNNYVTLDGKTMFLVTAKASVDTGKALAYDGNTMYYSNVYEAWSYLVITEGTLTVEDAKAVITLAEADASTLDQTYDVNESGRVDINDAQLVFDMYNNEYQDFNSATMQKFLKADVTGDKHIDVNDAAAVVADILAQ